MISADEWFSITAMKMWSNAGTAGTAGLVIGAPGDGRRRTRRAQQLTQPPGWPEPVEIPLGHDPAPVQHEESVGVGLAERRTRHQPRRAGPVERPFLPLSLIHI